MAWVNLNTIYATKSDLNTGLAARVPTSRTINGKALSSNVTLGASDIKLSDSTTLQSAWDSISQTVILADSINMYMSESHSVTLSQKVSQQKHGIVLCWAKWDKTNKKTDGGANYFFVPKEHVYENNGGCVAMPMTAWAKFDHVGVKYPHIYDDKVVGQGDATASGTSNGIKYDNSQFVLHRIIGV